VNKLTKKKTTPTKPTEAETKDDSVSWYDEATPTGEYLPKLEGINYYELLDKGELKVSTIEDREVKNVEFEAIHHETTNLRGKPIAESPEDPVEGILSIPLSAARKIRAKMEEKELKMKNLVGMILGLQKTGEKLKTRYPSVELIKKEDYFE
jgi:hypothetical protein